MSTKMKFGVPSNKQKERFFGGCRGGKEFSHEFHELTRKQGKIGEIRVNSWQKCEIDAPTTAFPEEQKERK